MNVGDIWGAQDDKPKRNPLDAPTRALGSAQEEIQWNLRIAKRFITQWIGTGTQRQFDSASRLLDITGSEHLAIMTLDGTGIDMVRLTDIGRQAMRQHLGHDITKYLFSVPRKECTIVSAVLYDRLYAGKYDKFTVNQLQEIWEMIPAQYQDFTL